MVNLIIQAGGKGSRLEHYCWNKPKCLVPINGKPMLYHLLDRFQETDARATLNTYVIAEHRADVLERYMAVFPPQQTVHIQHPHDKGTASGIAEALTHIADDEPVWIVWSDLHFQEAPPAPTGTDPIIYLSRSFSCRWSVTVSPSGSPSIVEQSSTESGIMGLFWFPNKSFLTGLPEGGRVRPLAIRTSNKIPNSLLR